VSESKVVLEGYNPFPWPVTVKQHGVTVIRPPGREAEAEVIFAAGVEGEVV
jgi:hypothetical protein